jgi:hypothetical protein
MVVFNDFILWWSIWSSSEIPLQDSWQIVLSLRLIYGSIALHTAIWYFKKSRERPGWYSRMLRVQATFFSGMCLYMVLKVLEARVLTAPQLTWSTLLFYILLIGATIIPPITQLVMKAQRKEVWDGKEKRRHAGP